MKILLDRGGERVDVALCRLVPDLSRSAAQKLLENGAVTCGGKPVRKQDKTVEGRELELILPALAPIEAAPQAIALDVRYEDDDLIVINKPKGMVVHPAAGHPDGTLVNALLHHCAGSLSGVNGMLRPGIVHRIDKDTSGLLIAAKNDFAHQALAAQLEDHTLCRVYDCICRGGFSQDVGMIEGPIGRHPADRKKMTVTEKNSRPALTHWQVLERFSGYTRLECRLETGRTHQIRVHLAWRGHPILGDLVYGRKKPELGQDTQCLHAKALTFVHPRTGQAVTITCDLPAYYEQLLEKLRRIG